MFYVGLISYFGCVIFKIDLKITLGICYKDGSTRLEKRIKR